MLPPAFAHYPTYAKRFLKVKDPRYGQIVPFNLKPIQLSIDKALDDLLSTGRPALVQILKARRLGSSTQIAGRFSHRCYTRQGQRAAVIAHSKDGVETIFEIYERFYNNLPSVAKPRRQGSHGKQIRLPNLDSMIEVGSALSTDFGRGSDAQMLHISEFQSENFANPESFLQAILPTLSVTGDGILIIEGTGNGPDTFWADLWRRSLDGVSGFAPLFFAFFEDPVNRLTPALADDELTEEEQSLKELYKLDNQQLTWLRHQLEVRCFGNWKRRCQEFPCTWEEALTAVGETPWDLDVVEPVHQHRPVVFQGEISKKGLVRKRDGELKIWEHPEGRAVYCIGVDCADGLATSDLQVASVFKVSKRPGEWPVQVAEWAGHMEAIPFAEMLHLLGHYFNKALMAVEVNNMGRAIQNSLQRIFFYPNLYRWLQFDRYQKKANTLGWQTTWQSKDVLLAVGDWVLRCGKVTIRSDELVHELIHYELKENTSDEYIGRCGDDRIMAFLIAIVCWFQHQFPGVPLKELRPTLAKLYGAPSANTVEQRVSESPAGDPPENDSNGSHEEPPLPPPSRAFDGVYSWHPREVFEKDGDW